MTAPESHNSGLFVALEGGEGAGKSTVAQLLADRLRERGLPVLTTREPGGTSVGEELRSLLHQRLAPWAEVFAFLAARAQLVDEVISPALAGGALVICDRFEASTFAYQGYARGLDLGLLWAANEAATTGLHPDLTVWLDIEPKHGLARKHDERQALVTGSEDVAFHTRVREGYAAQLAEAVPGTWLKLDATLPLDDVVAAIMAEIRGIRPSRHP